MAAARVTVTRSPGFLRELDRGGGGGGVGSSIGGRYRLALGMGGRRDL
jgi:hypothetical protein